MASIRSRICAFCAANGQVGGVAGAAVGGACFVVLAAGSVALAAVAVAKPAQSSQAVQ
jgi:hypothetical protein